MELPIKLFKVYMAESAATEVTKVLNSGYIGQGSKVEEFELCLRNYLGIDLILTTNSATSAQHLAIHLLKKPDLNNEWPGWQVGDEVLTTPLTCTATNWPILANGLNIRWVDVDRRNLNIDLDDLARKITPKTKIIVVVHWGGYPVDLDKLRLIQEEAKNLIGFKPMIIEDCAHAFGAVYRGVNIGSHGNICVFSFQAIKHVTSVDGGAIIAPHSDFYRRAKLLRWYGIDRESNRKDFRCEDDIEEWGFKFHMNDVNAAVGVENLKQADWILSKHRNNAGFYNIELSNVHGVKLLENVEDRISSYWIYTLMVENQPSFLEWMKNCGIIVSRVHERNDIHTCVRQYKYLLPNLNQIVNQMICIPVGWWVTDEQRQYIVDCIKKGW